MMVSTRCRDVIVGRLEICSLVHGSCDKCRMKVKCRELFDSTIINSLSAHRAEELLAEFQRLIDKSNGNGKRK